MFCIVSSFALCESGFCFSPKSLTHSFLQLLSCDWIVSIYTFLLLLYVKCPLTYIVLLRKMLFAIHIHILLCFPILGLWNELINRCAKWCWKGAFLNKLSHEMMWLILSIISYMDAWELFVLVGPSQREAIYVPKISRGRWNIRSPKERCILGNACFYYLSTSKTYCEYALKIIEENFHWTE